MPTPALPILVPTLARPLTRDLGYDLLPAGRQGPLDHRQQYRRHQLHIW